MTAMTLGACACPGPVTITRGDAVLLEACVDIAQTEAERRMGLRGRAPLAEGEGLLIALPIEEEICIVNDGVASDLDVLFASESGAVVAIERAVPAGDETLRCHPQTAQLLEMRAGTFAQIQTGDSLR